MKKIRSFPYIHLKFLRKKDTLSGMLSFLQKPQKISLSVKLCEQIYLFECKSVYILLDLDICFCVMVASTPTSQNAFPSCYTRTSFQDLAENWKMRGCSHAGLIGWAAAFLFVHNLPIVHTMLRKLCGWVSVWIIATSRILHFAIFFLK
jgi:hypothetical protein